MKPRTSRHALLVLFTLAVTLLSPAMAGAQSDADKRQRAKEHYEMATRFYDVGKYGDAISEYEAAYLLTGDPALLFNIGQAYRLWDHSDDALRVYKNYLRQRPDAPNRADVERKIADLEELVDDRRRSGPAQPTEPPSGTGQVAPPDTELGQTPPPAGPMLPPGPVEPPPVPNPLPPPAGIAVATTPAPSLWERPWLRYSLLGVSGASFVTMTIACVVGANKANKLRDASLNRDVFDPAVESNGQAANAVAVMAGIVGIAAGGAGGYLWWRARKAAKAQVAFTPTVSPSFAGGSAVLTF